MSTMQSKLVSRTIWLEKKKIWKINKPKYINTVLDAACELQIMKI